MITERHFKNEDGIKDRIVEAHGRGVCDSNGNSIKTTNAAGQRVFIAKPRFGLSSAIKTYVCRKGRMVLKNG
jgi:hypothetical protein